MSSFYLLITLSSPNLSFEQIGAISSVAQNEYGCDGVEEYSLEESQVDEILKEKAFSGGDVGNDVLSVMEKGVEKEKEFSLKFYFSTSDYEERGENFKKYLGENYSDYTIKLEKLEYQDWNQSFRDHFQKIPISDRIEVIPSWEKENQTEEDAKKHIYIYPGQGFGTGNHETTYLCLKLYDDFILAREEVGNCLDFGCGSGILGIAPLKWTGSNIDFVDIDKTALDNTLQNLQINFEQDLSGSSLILRSKFQAEKTYDLVFANILEHILIEEKETLLSSLKGGAHLIISGILNHQEETIMEEFSELDPIKVERKNDWSAILFKKTK